MTTLSQKRARILRVRHLEHRVARAKLATAEATLANLDRIFQRLSSLRATLKPDSEFTNGLALKAMAEMAHRLEVAQADLAAPIEGAKNNRVRSIAERTIAKNREQGAEKLRDHAVHLETFEQGRRDDANRPFRKRNSASGEAK